MPMEPETPQPARFRFSIRELLLAMVAVSAVVALFVKNRPYSPTEFIQQFDERAIVQAICKDKNIKCDIGGSSSSEGAIPGGSHRTASLYFRQPPPIEFESIVMPAMLARVESLLEDLGCEIDGRSKGGTTDFKQLQEFGFRYRQGNVRGVLRVYAIPYPENQVRLMVWIDEH